VAVLDHSRQIHRAVPLTKLPQLVAGDRVECDQDEGSTLRVVSLIERDGVLSKKDRRGKDKPLAANVSHLAIVSADVVINKADLLNEQQHKACIAMLEVYKRVGYPALLIDTKNDGMMDSLETELSGKTAVLVGASGVGKSSIVQRLLPDLDVRVGAISAATGFGAHTTSVTFWYELNSGGSIIDSPGVRQYSVAHLSAEDVRFGYRELAVASQACKFSNCSHVVEPGCAVQSAIANGSIARWRFDNYCKLAELE